MALFESRSSVDLLVLSIYRPMNRSPIKAICKLSGSRVQLASGAAGYDRSLLSRSPIMKFGCHLFASLLRNWLPNDSEVLFASLLTGLPVCLPVKATR